MAEAITHQPLAVSEMITAWDTGLFACCDDMKTCCYAFWCCPCFACTTTGQMGEHRCLPLLDMCSPAILAACSIPLFVPPAALAVRVAIRYRYGIKGTLCNDICTSCFCECCSWCQMARELKKRKKDGPAVHNVKTKAPSKGKAKAKVKSAPVEMAKQPAGPAAVGPQPGYGVPAGFAVGPQPGYGVPAGFAPQPQGPVVYHQY